MGLFRKLSKPFIFIFVLTWDFALFLLNIILPAHQRGRVVPTDVPGHALNWPTYEPPKPTDSRSACTLTEKLQRLVSRPAKHIDNKGPMLNALANHNILPHDGRSISFRTLNTVVRQSFNFAPSFCFFVPHFAADFLNRSYWSDTFDLEELSKHNEIEHDASLTRRDAAHEPDQGKPDLELVEQLLGSATGGSEESRVLTKKDLSAILSRRRVECRLSNSNYSETFFHKGFGSANSSTMLTIFGGRIEDLKPMLLEERFADGWEPRILSRFGLTMAAFNGTVVPVERGVDTEAYSKQLERRAMLQAGAEE